MGDAGKNNKSEWSSHATQGVCDLASKYRGRDDCQIISIHHNAFTVSIRLHWEDGEKDWLLRCTLPGKSSLLDEKVENEAIAMKFVARHTPIPVPRVIAYGKSSTNPTGLGPFIIMTWVEGRKMSSILRKDGCGGGELDPHLDAAVLEALYGQMAEILLELWKLDFDCIGSLGQAEMSGKVAVDRRPAGLGMSEVARTCDLSDVVGRARVYHSSADYVYSLLELQGTHLARHHGRGVAGDNTTQYRQQYACRHLMRAVALNFIPEGDNYGPFKLFAERLSPEHVLVDESLQVASVVNWEFCYAAPSAFAGSVPWWLLLRPPQKLILQWGVERFLNAYLPRAELFVQMVERTERARGMGQHPLSVRMRQSVLDKSVWFSLACRTVTAVDVIYWNCLDEFCWGPRPSIMDRAHAFTDTGMHKARDPLVRRKVDDDRAGIFRKTEPTRWRLDVNSGVHHWRYLNEADAAHRPQSAAEKYFLGLPTGLPSLPNPQNFHEAARNGFRFYQQLQLEDGHWGCGYGGPSFLLAGIIISMYITDTPIPEEWKIEIVRYLHTTVNADGGWGLHSAGHSTVFATTLYYVTIRILGLEASHPLAVKARARLQALGGPTGIPQWGKVWLSLLNLYDWRGVNPIPPEFWLLPNWVPFHPWRWWIQCRVVYLPVSYLYSQKVQKPLNSLLASLRQELYAKPFEQIDFVSHRNYVAPSDLMKPASIILRTANVFLRIWERYFRPTWLARWATSHVCDLIQREDENTSYNCLAPVNKAFHMVSVWHSDGGDSVRMSRHREKVSTYMWKDADGLTCSGTNGIQLWDTAFSIQAAVESGLVREPEFQSALEKALDFLDISQLRDNLADPYRQPRKGGWPFSTVDNGYIVSDCSAEGLKSTLMLQEECKFPKRISNDRLQDCVDTLLLMQNPGGGFASYENTRASELLEHLNASEVFDRIMVEYSYPECTTAVVTALALFRRHFPTYRANDIEKVLGRATGYIERAQRPDGSWYGSWGVCFTYAIMFAVQSLELTGQTFQTSERVRRSCKFLVEKQKADGGWGEHYTSCEKEVYVQHEESQVVNTAWACLALMYARYPYKDVIERGLKLIMSRQQENGEWYQEDVEGVFNNTCMIGYPNYKLYFTVWALGRYTNIYLPMLKGLDLAV
ncbi:hypothetical protein FE257_004409 [Aspergillus nanangensis]|uniref:lanosterol synthase n=1 Tax=Aspergillus nanangensis TaxID=2582783 RepID=A0AAD4CYH4_ASPNN|nr:hypothetical protein FE257_004409 [Aspergillus nanangensis]